MINATDSTSSAAAAAAAAAVNATSSTSSASGSASSEDRFLKLLVAQLSNQDPMNPMDNAQMTSQMAQISTVSSVQQVNDTLKSLATQFSSMQMLQAGSLVGHDVLVPGSKLAVENGTATAAIDLDTKADSVKVEVLSAGGTVVDSFNLGPQDAGRHTFEWDASAHPGIGTPSYRVTATLAGNKVTATPLTRDKVVSVSSDNGVMNMQLQVLGSVAYDTVKAIL